MAQEEQTRTVTLSEDQVVFSWMYDTPDYVLLPKPVDLAIQFGDWMLNGSESALGGEVILRASNHVDIELGVEYRFAGVSILSNDTIIGYQKVGNLNYATANGSAQIWGTSGWHAVGNDAPMFQPFPMPVIGDQRINQMINVMESRVPGFNVSNLSYVSISERTVMYNYRKGGGG